MERNMVDDALLKPLDAYNSRYKEEFAKNTADYFEELLQKSGVNEGENDVAVQKYQAKIAQVEHAEKRANSTRIIKTVMIVLSVLMFVLSAFLIVCALGSYGQGNVFNTIMFAVGAVIAIILGVLLLVYIKKKINIELEKRQKHYEKLCAEAQELLNQAYQMMQPLNELYDWGITSRLVKKTVPLLNMDEHFDIKRFKYFEREYGFFDNYDDESSTIYVQSGDILGNPFLFQRELELEMGTKTYYGERVVTWVEYVTDDEGHTRAVTKSDVLHASVIKPYPMYFESTNLFYGNDAAPDLKFSRGPKVGSDKSDKAIDRMVRRGENKLRRQAEKALAKGENFTAMANSEFDVLFGATDRTHEAQFRLLFTPLAQQNMVDLIRSKEPYGDDFYFKKHGEVNMIRSQHSQNWDMNTSPSRYYSYSVKRARQIFNNFNNEYFKNLYFDFAPLLSIPLYQQHKSVEYIYEGEYERNCTLRETEVMANSFDEDVFSPQNSATRSILKTKLLGKHGKFDEVVVTAYSYEGVHRVDFVPTLCRNGNIYDVPVEWIEYIPISKDTNMLVSEVSEEKQSFEKRQKENKFSDFIGKYASNNSFKLQRGLIAFIKDNYADYENVEKDLDDAFM